MHRFVFARYQRLREDRDALQTSLGYKAKHKDWEARQVTLLQLTQWRLAGEWRIKHCGEGTEGNCLRKGTNGKGGGVQRSRKVHSHVPALAGAYWQLRSRGPLAHLPGQRTPHSLVVQPGSWCRSWRCPAWCDTGRWRTGLGSRSSAPWRWQTLPSHWHCS